MVPVASFSNCVECLQRPLFKGFKSIPPVPDSHLSLWYGHVSLQVISYKRCASLEKDAGHGGGCACLGVRSRKDITLHCFSFIVNLNSCS